MDLPGEIRLTTRLKGGATKPEPAKTNPKYNLSNLFDDQELDLGDESCLVGAPFNESSFDIDLGGGLTKLDKGRSDTQFDLAAINDEDLLNEMAVIEENARKTMGALLEDQKRFEEVAEKQMRATVSKIRGSIK